VTTVNRQRPVDQVRATMLIMVFSLLVTLFSSDAFTFMLKLAPSPSRESRND
jgi:hypothetical protein